MPVCSVEFIFDCRGTIRSSCSQMYYKIGVHKNFPKFTEKTCVGVSSSCEFCKTFKNIFFQPPPVAVSKLSPLYLNRWEKRRFTTCMSFKELGSHLTSMDSKIKKFKTRNICFYFWEATVFFNQRFSAFSMSKRKALDQVAY